MYIYLASPYSHEDPQVMHARYEATLWATGMLLEASIPIYSPIVHCHEIAARMNLPKDFEYWQRYNERMLAPARKLYVLKLDGWEKSRGVCGEINYARTHYKPTVYITLDDIRRERIEDFLVG